MNSFVKFAELADNASAHSITQIKQKREQWLDHELTHLKVNTLSVPHPNFSWRRDVIGCMLVS